MTNKTFNVQLRSIDEIKPYERNPRLNDKAVDAVAASLQEFGFRQPIVVDAEGVIIVGHTRWKAAKKLGLAKVPVHVAKDLTAEQARAYRLEDNKSGELATWDFEKLTLELSDLREGGYDLGGLSFDEDEIEALLDGPQPGLTDPDAVPPEPAKPITRPGDIWHLGEHRLLCGDSTDRDEMQRLIGDGRADLFFTDPPYGVAIGAKNAVLNASDGGARNSTRIEADDLTPADLKARLLPAFVNARCFLSGTCSVFVTVPEKGQLGLTISSVLREADLPVRHVLIWAKSQPTFSLGRLDYDYQHEPILFTWTKTHKRLKRGPHQTSVWPIPKPQASVEHPTMKPVELVTNAMLNHTEPGDLCLDIYAGSGTTIIAAEQLGRKCYAIEISPAYCDVAVRRWEEFTGKKAERDAVAASAKKARASK